MGALASTGALMAAGAVHADTNYTVKAGDTVSQLALDYNSSVDAITQQNHLADPNFIVVGQHLDIPNDDNDGQTAGQDNSQVTAQNTSATTADASAAVLTPTANVNANDVNSGGNQNSTINLGNNTSVVLPTKTASNTANTNATVQPQTTATTNTQAAATTNVQTAGGNGGSNVTPANATHSPAQAVAIAQAQIGTPYVWGGNQPGGFDCSGLVQYAYGLDAAHRTTYTQETMGAHHYDVQNAQPGDIYFWGTDSAPYHEALATGNGNYIQAPQPGQNVQNGNINWYRPNYYVSMNN